MSLNVNKTVFIPLWPCNDFSDLRRSLGEVCAAWQEMLIQRSGKYLGYILGPGAGNSSWEKPLVKYVERAKLWSSLRLGLHYNMLVYKVFIATVLAFVMQLEPDHPDLMEHFDVVKRRLLPGPGNWVSRADAHNLQDIFKLPHCLPDPRWVSLACKLRIVRDIAPDCMERCAELE